MSEISKQNNAGIVNTETKQLSVSERFTQAVLTKFASENGAPTVTPFQKRLIQGYFIKIDQTLKLAEIKRLQKSEQYREPLPYTWDNVNMNKLAIDVVAFSSVGLDPNQKNHIHPIPYKNNALNKYDLQFTLGYNGIELKAKKYGLDVPNNVVIKLVYSNEKFTPIYKGADSEIETFRHIASENPFDKGEIIGGYYYYEYSGTPSKNTLRVFSLNDIKKRIPKTASVEFWGGEKKKYNSQETEKVEGWFDEMCWKTIKRAAYDAIPIDSQKIDDHIQSVISESNMTESLIETTTESKVEKEIQSNANTQPLDFSNIEEAEVVAEEVVSESKNEEIRPEASQPLGQTKAPF